MHALIIEDEYLTALMIEDRLREKHPEIADVIVHTEP